MHDPTHRDWPEAGTDVFGRRRRRRHRREAWRALGLGAAGVCTALLVSTGSPGIVPTRTVDVGAASEGAAASTEPGRRSVSSTTAPGSDTPVTDVAPTDLPVAGGVDGGGGSGNGNGGKPEGGKTEGGKAPNPPKAGDSGGPGPSAKAGEPTAPGVPGPAPKPPTPQPSSAPRVATPAPAPNPPAPSTAAPRPRTVITRAPTSTTTAAPAKTPPEGDRAASSPEAERAEQRFVELINRERTRQGLKALRVNPAVTSVARGWSAEMLADREACRNGDFDHNPRFAQELPSSKALAENVGCGPSADIIHVAFMRSSSHRAAILDPRMSDVGVGVSIADDGTVWVTQNFGAY